MTLPDWMKPIALLAFASLFALDAFRAVRTGALKPSLYDRVYFRAENPGTFWFHVAVDVIVALAFVVAAVTSA